MDQTRLRELEAKKQRLAELKESRRRQDEDRRRSLMPLSTNALQNGNGVPRNLSLTDNELTELLENVGIPAQASGSSNSFKGPEAGKNVVENGVPQNHVSQTVTLASRVVSLGITEPISIAVPQKDTAIYCKTTQTDDEKFSLGEFSMGSQEFCYDDDMMPSYKQPIEDSDFHALQRLDSSGSPTDEIARLLPGFSFGKHHEAEKKVVEEEKPKLPDLSEEEKQQVISTLAFQAFFGKASKLIERALAEEVFADYVADETKREEDIGERLTLRRTFIDPKWTEGREVIAITFSEQFPELFAVAYDTNCDKPGEPAGVVAVFNTKFKREYSEFLFHVQSRITSVTFARFNPNLILAGCYTGQIFTWDNRVVKKTPTNKSPLSTTTHTQPIFSIQVVGTQNAHNLLSVSTDGRICSWNVDNLSQTVESKNLFAKKERALRPIFATCMSFPNNDFNNYVIGAEDGNIHLMSRHSSSTDTQIIEQQLFEGHSAPISAVAFHRASGLSHPDFTHLFLSSSCDWSVKLWSIKDPLLHYSFEMSSEYIYDVQWSPVHPAVFATIDADGNLSLWNLNEDSEGPIAKILIEKENISAQGRKLAFSGNGQFIITGDTYGKINVFELQDYLYNNVKLEESNKFTNVLADIKAAREENEEVLEARNRIDRAPSAATSAPSAVSILAGGGASPRQNWP